MNKLTRFIKTSFVYFIGSVLSKLLSIFLLPLYTSRISPDALGNYDLYVSIVNLIAPLAFIQIWDGVYRFAFDSSDKEWKEKTITNGFVISIFGCIIYCILLGITLIWYPAIQSPLIYIYGILVAFQYLYTVICRVYLDNILLITSGLINTIITFGCNIFFIVYCNMGTDALFLSSIIGIVIQIVVIELKLNIISHIKRCYISILNMRDMIKFSLPLCINTISYWLLMGYTKVTITNILGASSNGLFSVANKFTVFVTLIISVFQFAWNEMIYLSVNEEKSEKLYGKGIHLILKLLLLGSAIFTIVIKIVFPYLIDRSYYDAYYIIPIALIGVAANSFASFAGTIFLSDKNSKRLVFTVMLSAIINVILSPISTSYMGLYGAISVLSISYLVNAVLRLVDLKNKYGIGFRLDILPSVILFIGSFFIYYLVDNIIILILLFCLFSILSIYILRSLFVNIFKSLN